MMKYENNQVKDLTIAYIGGGSRGWAWTFMTDIAMDDQLSGTIRLYDIDEEAATGTSNGALTYYGYLNEFVKSGDDCKFIQGEKMKRPSVIESHIEVDGDNCLIRVGGGGVMLAEGEINL